MKQKLANLISSIIIISLLIAGSIFNIGWALTTVEVVYWVAYPILFILLTLLLIGVFTGNVNEKTTKKISESKKWWDYLTLILVVGLLLNAGLMALPVIVILGSIYTHVIIYLAKELNKDE